jgi:hypothetical protein
MLNGDEHTHTPRHPLKMHTFRRLVNPVVANVHITHIYAFARIANGLEELKHDR